MASKHNSYVDIIPLKQYFGGESSGFTPWLSQQNMILEDIFQETDLTLYKRELKVDKFYVDIAFRKNNEIYIVENQYGESDHDHLGKCTVYSMLTNAKKTCWICETISDEYVKIFRYLNFDLYIVEFSVIRTQNEYEIIKIACHTTKGVKYLYYRSFDNGKKIERVVK